VFFPCHSHNVELRSHSHDPHHIIAHFLVKRLTAPFGQLTVDPHTVCLSGDGGNDVSMIQAANVGVGIEGKV
jgi:phosphoserine phosphatase